VTFLAWSLVAVLVLFSMLWVVSLVVRDASIVDRFWGIAFIVIASYVSAATDGFPKRAHLVLLLTALWGVRLSVYITARNLGEAEDYRYRAMRRQWGSSFPLASLGTVFLLQGFLAWVVSLPVQVAVASVHPLHLTYTDYLGAIVWAAGFLIESVADVQLASFRGNPRNQGRVMKTGLWRYSRHPNYFGDALLWWGLWLIALSVGGWWTAIGPAVMTLLLLRVSGVAMLERKLRRSRPGYDDYVQSTSAFVPMPPRPSRQGRDPRSAPARAATRRG
jgi:steroid 5-alpha reductase family enzyme